MNVQPQVETDSEGKPTRVSFTFPVWKSSKNDVALARGKLRKGDRSRRHGDALHLVAASIASSVSRGTVFGDIDDVALELTHNVRDETVTVVVRSLGKPGKVDKRTGRNRDVHNLLDTLADALEGALYANDKQVALAIARRSTE